MGMGDIGEGVKILLSIYGGGRVSHPLSMIVSRKVSSFLALENTSRQRSYSQPPSMIRQYPGFSTGPLISACGLNRHRSN